MSPRCAAQVSTALVVTTEQVASYIAGRDLQLGYKAANAFLLYVVTEGDAPLIERLQDASWLVTAIFGTVERMQEVDAADEASVTAVADAVVLANQQLVVRRGEFDGDVESLAVDWAKIAHSADVGFAQSAADLREGDLTTESYRYHLPHALVPCTHASSCWILWMCTASTKCPRI